PGRQGPRRTTGLEMMEALQAVVRAYGAPAAIVGHSLGAATTAWAIRDGLPSPSRLALIAPTVGPVPYIGSMARMLGFTDRTRQAMLRQVEAMLNRPMGDFDVVTAGNGMPPT